MQTLEQRIVGCARGWLGTRFQHQGRLKRTAGHKGGVDCLGLLTGVARELDLRGSSGLKLADLDRADYGHLPDGLALQAALSAHLYPHPVSNIPPGGILLMALEGVPRHLAIASDYPIPPWGIGMIHAYAQARKVVEHRLDADWQRKICAVFRISPQ